MSPNKPASTTEAAREVNRLVMRLFRSLMAPFMPSLMRLERWLGEDRHVDQ